MIDFRRLSCVGTMHLPAFHALGTIMHFIVPLSSITTVALYPPTSLLDHTKLPVVPSSDNIIENCSRTGVDVLVAVPSFLETWIVEPKSIDWLKTLDFVVGPSRFLLLQEITEKYLGDHGWPTGTENWRCAGEGRR